MATTHTNKHLQLARGLTRCAARHWPAGGVAPAGHNPVANPRAYMLRIYLATLQALRTATPLANPLAVYAAVPSNAPSTPTMATGCYRVAS